MNRILLLVVLVGLAWTWISDENRKYRSMMHKWGGMNRRSTAFGGLSSSRIL